MVDAGLDLGKTEPQSLVLLRQSDRLAELGYPVFLSASNKRFLWKLLDVDVDGPGRAPWPPTPSASGSAVACCAATTCAAGRRVADVMAAVLAASDDRASTACRRSTW